MKPNNRITELRRRERLLILAKKELYEVQDEQFYNDCIERFTLAIKAGKLSKRLIWYYWKSAGFPPEITRRFLAAIKSL